MVHYSRNLIFILIPILFSSCSGGAPIAIPAATQITVPQVANTIAPRPTQAEQHITLSAYHRIGNGSLQQVKWTKDGNKIIVGTTAGVFVYDGGSFSLVNEFGVGQSVYYLAVHPSGDVISVGADKSDYENITLWDVQTGTPVVILHGDCECVFTNVDFSPDGKLLAAGNDKGQVWVWELESRKVFRVLEFSNPSEGYFVRYVEFSPDGLSLVAGSGNLNGVIEIFNLVSGKQVFSLDAGFLFLDDLNFSPDGKRLAVAGNLVTNDIPFERHEVTVFDAATGDPLYSIDLVSKSVDFVLYNPDNLSIVTGSCQSFGSHSEVCLKAQIAEWNAQDGTFIRASNEYASSLVAGDYSPDGQRFSIITWDKIPLFETWDLATNKIIQTEKWFVGPSSRVIFSHDSARAIWGESNGSIRFLDFDTRTVISTWNDGNDEVVNLAMSNDGLMLASSARYGAITLWNVQTGDVLDNIKARDGFQIYSIEFSSDRRWLAWTEEDLYRMDESQIQIYDVEQKVTKLSVRGVSFDIAFSPDNSTIAIVDSDDKTVRLFEIETGLLLRTFVAPDYIDQIDFASNGTLLVADCSNTNILFWEIQSGKLLNSFDTDFRSDTGSVPFALFPKSAILVFSLGPNLKILDLENYQIVLEETNFTGGMRNLTVSPNEKLIATSMLGEAAWIWQVNRFHGK